MSSVPTITFEPRLSPGLTVVVVVMTTLALVAVWLSRLPAWASVLVCALVLGYVALSCLRTFRSGLARVSWSGDGHWHVVLADGTEAPARLVQARRTGPLIVLRLTWAQRATSAVFLTADNTPADTLRRLRMRLSSHADSA